MSAAPYNQAHDVNRAAGPCPVIETARLRLRPQGRAERERTAAGAGVFQRARLLGRGPMPNKKEEALEGLRRRVAAALRN